MLKLNESRLEIEISSPTELLAWAEDFKTACERFKRNAKEIVDSNTEDMSEARSHTFIITDGVKVSFYWKPKYEGYDITNF